MLEVLGITTQEAKDWILNKHYAGRMPSISYCYGLYMEGILSGVCSVGKPASPQLCIGICGKENSDFVYELNRLVVNDGLPKNALSMFVSKCLKSLPQMIIVSYADTGMNHTGYIYQATNWIYTGITKERTDIGTEDGKHSRHYDKNIDYKKNRVLRTRKHRYVYFVGGKKQKKKWRNQLRYDVLPYPKGDNKRYDSSYKPKVQLKMF